jgi:hypothetical protein
MAIRIEHMLGGRMLILFMALSAFAAAPHHTQERADQPRLSSQPRLAALLKKSAEYCRRLDKAALDFVCLEEVTELTARFTPHTRVLVYDYQLIRKNKETKEKRNLLEVDGRKTDIQDSSLQTVMFQYENVLFGPVGLLSEFWQAYHVYTLIGEDKVNKEKAVVIEATPRQAFDEPHCYGRIWVNEDDGSVLKIVWDQKSLGNYQAVEEFAKSHDAEAQITAFSEYGLEKNGLRFPSRNYSEQAYILSDKRKIVNARISVIYKKYKFFTVETEVDFK